MKFPNESKGELASFINRIAQMSAAEFEDFRWSPTQEETCLSLFSKDFRAHASREHIRKLTTEICAMAQLYSHERFVLLFRAMLKTANNEIKEGNG